MGKRPGGEVATRPLHFIWIADCSSSMSGEKIQSLNFSIRESIPEIRKVAGDNAHANVLVRAVSFSSGAQWHAAQPTPIETFAWTDLSAQGVTDMGHALRLVADELKMPPMTDRALPPVLVLVSDGQPTDDFNSGLKALMDQPWGKKSVRIAIAIGKDADIDVLQKFMGASELKPLVATNAQDLVKYMRWVSTVVQAASAPASQVTGKPMTNVPLPPPPQPTANPTSADAVW